MVAHPGAVGIWLQENMEGSAETVSGKTINEETDVVREREAWLRVISMIAGLILGLFGVIMIKVLSSSDNAADESVFSAANFFVMTTMIVLPITTALFLIDIGFRKKINVKPAMVETIIALLTGSVWIVSGLFTAVISIRNLLQGWSGPAPIILIILSGGAIVCGSILMRGMLKKRVRQKNGGKA